MAWLPGSNLLRQAWDATKLVGVILDKKKERALVLAEETKSSVVVYRGQNATKKMKEVFEEGNVEEIAKLYMPEKAVQVAKDMNGLYWKIWDLYWFFALFRLFNTLSPWNNFVFSEETSQGLEMLYKDIFQLDITPSPELNSTAPTRSMVLPMIFFGIPLYIFKIFDLIAYTYLGVTLVQPYFLILIPRLVMTILSFAVDFCIYQVCVLYNHSFNRCLVTLATSYVMIVYSTRTMVDSFELVLFSLLFYLVAHCMKRTSETLYLQAMVQAKYDKAETTRERVELRKRRRRIPDHDFKYFVPISVICALGVFNRPSFVIWALAPLYFWFQRGIATDSYFTPFILLHFRMVSLVPGFIVTSLILVLIDSLYFGHLTATKLWDLSMSWDDWKCTPLQFLLRNAIPGHLTMPEGNQIYQHAMVTVPYLLGPLGLITLVAPFTFATDLWQKKWQDKPGVRTVYALTLFSFVIPLILLSLLPHQDHKQLIPLLPLAVLLSAHHLRKKVKGLKPLLSLWHLFNIVLMIMNNTQAQGGVFSMSRFVIDNRLPVSADTREVQLIFIFSEKPSEFELFQNPPGLEPLPHHSKRHYRLKYEAVTETELDRIRQVILAITSRANYMSAFKKRQIFISVPTEVGSSIEAYFTGSLVLRKKFDSGLPQIHYDHNIFSIHFFYEFASDPWMQLKILLHEITFWFNPQSLSLYEVFLSTDVNTIEVQGLENIVKSKTV